MREHQHPLVNAILYADIFNFALTKEELYKFSIGKSTTKDIDTFLKKLPPKITYSNELFCLKNNINNIKLRLDRRISSNIKLISAKKIAKTLSIIPSIKFIGLSGALAMENASSEDDIDLFIITRSNSIWKTRLFVSLLLEILGKRRRKKSSNPVDLVCANMYLAENSLELSKNRQDIYTAHEIAQIIPLYNSDRIYERFLSANSWVLNFLPNALKLNHQNLETNIKIQSQNYIEKIAKSLQLWYMRRHITVEEINDKVLAFHPFDYRANTKSMFEERIKQYEKV